MKNSNMLNNNVSLRVSRILALSIMSVASLLLMFGLAVTANAATLTRELQVGSTGQDVSDLQIFLAKDATIYPQGLVTGYFGLLTKAAVSNFQARNGISVVGRVGPITLAAINAQMNGDTRSPMIGSLNVTVSSNSATLNWNTNENSTATVYYSTSFPQMTEGSPTSGITIGGPSILVHSDLRTSHSATINSLSPNTTYFYVVYAKDGSGNESILWPSTFKTNQ